MNEQHWALILGASSGFGEATALELAAHGMNIFGVHLDRRETLPHANEVADAIRKQGREAVFFNMNAADPEKRRDVIAHIRGRFEKSHSLVYWVQELMANQLMHAGGRIYAMTSEGGGKAVPQYGPVCAAKAILEAHIRQLALELAPQGITANAIMAGVTLTPALQKIPGNERLISFARARNPHGRLTTPQDVAKCIAVLCHENTYWMTGNTIRVDGGEGSVG